MHFFTKQRVNIYIGAALYVTLAFLMVWKNGDAGDLRTIRLAEWFGLGAVLALYMTLLVGPLYKLFPTVPGKNILLPSRGGFGDAAFVFGLVHASLAFWGLLGGFSGWVFLGTRYQVATLLSLTTLLLLCVLFGISVSGMAQKIFTKFPWMAKIGYIAGLLICVHVVLIGSHFRDPYATLHIIGFTLVSVLGLLLATQIDAYIVTRGKLQRFVGTFLVVALAIGGCIGNWYFGDSASTSVSGMNHAGMNMGAATGTQYTLSSNIPATIVPNAPVALAFSVHIAATGTQVKNFNMVHEKPAHLVVVNNALNYYSHLHPELKDGTFSITTTFPKDDNYRAYMSFEPQGETVEQVFAQSFVVGKGSSETPSKAIDASETKTVGANTVHLTAGQTLSVSDIANGKAKIDFYFKDAAGRDVTNLYPYLAAFGHLVMISTDTYAYIHVHPLITPFGPEDTNGPTVEFAPMGNIQPGVYKLFGQFAPNKELITVPFTIEVK